jgi:hypothetical protein
MASDAAMIVTGVVAVIAVGIAVFLLTQPPAAAHPSTVVVREDVWRPWPVWRPWGPYYQHLPQHHMLY